MDLAFSYDDYWPVEYRPMYAVMWTLVFGVATMVVFLGVYELGLSVAEMSIAGIPLFVGGLLISQLISYTLHGIVKTSLYYYAEGGECPEEFDDVFDQLEETGVTLTPTGPTTGGFR